MDTPETVHPTKGEQPGGAEASEYTRSMLEGKEVWLEYDTKRLDKYGRQLCHIWLEGGDLFNLRLVWHGYGSVSIYPPNTRYERYFIAAEKHAQAHRLGVWKSK